MSPLWGADPALMTWKVLSLRESRSHVALRLLQWTGATAAWRIHGRFNILIKQLSCPISILACNVIVIKPK